MPYIPRRYAPTDRISPELATQPRQSRKVPGKPPPPYHGSSEGEEPFEQGRGLEMVPRLSIREHTIDPVRVYKRLFGKEAVRDEFSGRLLPKD